MKKAIMYMLVSLCIFFSTASVYAEDDDSIKHFVDGSVTIDFFDGIDVDVPGYWGYKEYEELFVLFPGETPNFIFVLDLIDYGEEMGNSLDDLSLQMTAESIMNGFVGKEHTDKSKLSTLSNGEKAAIVSGTNFDSDIPQFGVTMTKLCGEKIFVVSMYGDLSQASNDAFFDDLDSILCSVKEAESK